MIVEEVEDFYASAVGEEKVGDVGLPALIGHFGFEADVGASWLLLRLRGNQACIGDDAADSGG